MNASPILLQKKYARVVGMFAELARLPMRDALGFFYRSRTYDLMSNGISDMHCRSDGYLAEDLLNEYRESLSS